MASWRLVAGWGLGVFLLVTSWIAVQIASGSLDAPVQGAAVERMAVEKVHLVSAAQVEERGPDSGYDWSRLPYICLVGGEAILAAWFLGKGTRLLPRGTHPLLPCVGGGLILSALLVSLVLWGSGYPLR